ncbi:ribosome small subunit-dependent GTPase A [Leptospira broomii serovar Hurstbridge str. 5399]|uniref:Small ribosomal subunit biogenesis GTPase RsgA n=1 Tax=Leptospira broomii serovar Hurstbridge str. 5399 TaxID=1049789 RepID=T0GDC3_9LEPT|nr:ribosome small subunit-dependent GTPase A [Leptospira broomii]EQA44804.1 ribosome small subunit-dependent GTPase A [Leptospira broomii serovar Hurstbridge str. 5399]
MTTPTERVKEFFTIATVFGAFYDLYSPKRGRLRAVLRGKLRTIISKERHPFVVGDLVLAEKSGGEWAIFEKRPRRNELLRKSKEGDAQVLCANVDQVAILASLRDPETKDGFLDRCLAAVTSAGIHPIILFTKKDLVDQKVLTDRLTSYTNLGYEVLAVSCKTGEGIPELISKFSRKTTFLAGNSGVGKSSLVNVLSEKELQKTSAVSISTHKGKHTTTNSNFLILGDDIILIDSPGIKEWGILHLTKGEILESFPEIAKFKDDCLVSNCCQAAPGCKLLEILELGLEIREERKKSLESMLASLENPFRITRRDHLKNESLS